MKDTLELAENSLVSIFPHFFHNAFKVFGTLRCVFQVGTANSEFMIETTNKQTNKQINKYGDKSFW